MINPPDNVTNVSEFNVHTCLRFYFKKDTMRSVTDGCSCTASAISLMTQSVRAITDVTLIFSPAGIKRLDDNDGAVAVQTPGLSNVNSLSPGRNIGLVTDRTTVLINLRACVIAILYFITVSRPELLSPKDRDNFAIISVTSFRGYSN